MTKSKTPPKTSEKSLRSILTLIKERTEVDLSCYKMSTIRRRIERQMRLRNFATLTRFANYLKKNPEALEELYADIFIHVTEFFRDPEAYAALAKKVFPELVKGKAKGDTLRVWVAGCSTGEEAYSLAISLTEFLKAKKLSLRVTVYATDISSTAIQFARKATYPTNSLEKISSKKILSYFENSNEGYLVRKEIREMCVFSEHELASTPPLSKMDLISCRNVLIYFGPELQKKLFGMFSFGLNTDGFLWLGTSESVASSPELFTVIDKKYRIYRKSPLSGITKVSEIPLVKKPGTPRKVITKLPSQITNEELQAAFEELQSSNEELETAKEELQCSNEELITANDELEARNLELKQANEKLARSEERFRLMVTSVKDYAIFMLDPQGNIASWNEGARRFKGYEEKEIIGRHFSTFYTKSDRDRNHPAYELKVATEEGRYEEEGWRIRKDGSQFWASVVITRINDARGTLIGFSKVTRDLTERRKAEDELRKSEERFRLMVSSVKDYAIFLLDPEGLVASWNEGAKRFKGYEANEIIGKHFRTFYTDADRAKKHPEQELQIAAEEGRYEEEGWRVRKNRTQFWANVTITRITGSDGNILGYVKVTRDLTERRIAEQELRLAYEGLERRVQERTSDLEAALRSRDEFLSIASHELKTPLTSLRLQLQLSGKRISMHKEESKLLQELSKSLDIGVRQVTSLTHLVNDLLDVSRIQTGVFMLEISTFNLSELVDEIATRFKEQLDHARSPLKLHLAPEVSGQWDRFRLEQVIVNLISNAIKYAPQAPLVITTMIENNRAILKVCDEGPGIEPQYVNKIFQRFERGNTPNTVGGLGLGLFITKKIIEHHAGSIRVESAPGKGATFIIELPMQQK